MFLPKPGLVVGNRYELTGAIGRGGMGEVWKAHDRELDTACAVKFILQHLATDRGIRDRFTREARAVARLRSPHVVHILGVGEVEDVPYLAMELLEGETLLARLDRLGKLDPFVTMKVVEQVGEALESAHHAGIVHRDLKPENIWFWAGSKVFIKVLDFGVAKTGLKTGSLQTATGALVGTPQYMSPEQALGNRDVDHRSDLWSLAVITVECLCGKRPFDSEGLGDLLLQIVSNTPPSLQELAPELPPSLHEWWARALARDPRQRFQSASELVEALRPHLVGNAPYSELVHSGFPHSGLPHSGLPHSGLPHSGFPHSGLPQSGLPHSGLPHSGLAAAGLPNSGFQVALPASGPVPSARPYSGREEAGRPGATDPGGWIGGGQESRSSLPRELQPHSAASIPSLSTGTAVVSERAARPSPGSVGPISSRRLPQNGRQRTAVVAAALLTVGVAGTTWRMLSGDAPESDARQTTLSSLPAPVVTHEGPSNAPPSDPSPPTASEPDVPTGAAPDGLQLPGSNPWDSALGNPRPGVTQTAVGALLPQRAPQQGDTGNAEAEAAKEPAAEKPGAVPSRATPARATPARAVPPRAAAPPAAPAAGAPAAAAPAPPRRAPSLSAADVGLSAPARVNPAQSAGKPGSEAAAADSSQGAGQADSEAERKAKLKRRIGLGSK